MDVVIWDIEKQFKKHKMSMSNLTKDNWNI
jgi:hypothetical protein